MRRMDGIMVHNTMMGQQYQHRAIDKKYPVV